MSFNKGMAIEKATRLLIDIRGNVTTLEVKKYLRQTESMKLTQQVVSDSMSNISGLDFTDNGVYRTYTATPAPVAIVTKDSKIKKVKTETVSKTKMVKMMEAAGGRFITVTFEKKNNDVRVMNCRVDTKQFMNSQGYINVHENGGKKGTLHRQVNPRTLLGLKINGTHYLRK
tara:strand:- start:353 stop:868 length:516 start_codon:yes stop_codon:yes gene_type:complete